MYINIFNKKIKIRDRYCAHNNAKRGDEVKKPYINLYVQITNACNMRCNFCCAVNNTYVSFNVDKFKKVILEIIKTVDLQKISFTGGEPTLFVDLLNELALFVKTVSPNTFVVINTNGFALEKINHKLFDSIALSRHHYENKQNDILFGKETISMDRIIGFPALEKIHLSCNLIKGYIDNVDQIIAYLHHAANLGIYDVGFVTLMDIGGFSSDNRIEFKNTGILNDNRFFRIHTWKDNNRCECYNFTYFIDETKYIYFYARQVLLSTNDSNIIFDGESLRLGFNKEIII